MRHLDDIEQFLSAMPGPSVSQGYCAIMGNLI